MKQLLIKLLQTYQTSLSPDHGWLKHRHPFGYCRFYPTCSQYAVEALERKGVAQGVGLILWRLIRCNPWSRGGLDPIK